MPFIKKALQQRPHYGEAYFYGGLVRFKLNQLDLAKTNFAKSFSFPSASIEAHYYLGKIFGTEKYYKGAIDELSTYVSKSSGGEHRDEAMKLLADFKKIINDTTGVAEMVKPVENAVAPKPEFAITVPESGYAVLEMRIDSLLTMQVADTLTDPGRAMLKGVNEFKAGGFDDAVKEFKKVMASYPSSGIAAPCTYDIGVCYLKLRLFPRADNQFDNLCNRYPNHPLASQSLFLKAFSFLERGDLTHSEKLFREFIQKYRNHTWTGRAYEKLGDIYEDLKQLNKAMDAYRQAAGRNKNFSDEVIAWYKLGSVYSEAGNPERAVASYKKAIEIGESHATYSRVPDSYYKIADCKYQQKDYKTALEYYQKAVRKYPTYQESPWGLFQLGNIYKNNKNYSKAIEIYKELIAGHPDDYWAKQARWKMDDAVWENEYKAVVQ
jgi:tetratricopeptide (TPR) repeat protein